MSLPQPPLLLITDRRQAARPLPEIIEAALTAGCRWVSLREKDLGRTELEALIAEIKPLIDRHGATLGLHGTAELAAALGLRALHLASGSDTAAARHSMGAGALVGISVHSAAEAAKLDPAHLDYAIIGPAFETASKPGYGPALGTPGIAEAAKGSSVPLIAVGGMAAKNAGAVLRAGAAGFAVMGGAMRADDPGRTMRELIVSLAGHA